MKPLGSCIEKVEEGCSQHSQVSLTTVFMCTNFLNFVFMNQVADTLFCVSKGYWNSDPT